MKKKNSRNEGRQKSISKRKEFDSPSKAARTDANATRASESLKLDSTKAKGKNARTVSQSRINSGWHQKMSQGKELFLSESGQNYDAQNSSTSSVVSYAALFQSALDNEMQEASKANRFRFWSLYLPLQYLQKSMLRLQHVLPFAESVKCADSVFRAYELAIEHSSSPRYRRLLISLAFDFVIEQVQFVDSIISPSAEVLRFHKSLVAFSESFCDDDLQEAELCKKIESLDSLADRYFELVVASDGSRWNEWTRKEKDELKSILQLTREDYLSVTTRLFDLLQDKKLCLDASVLYAKYNRQVVRTLIENDECSLDLALGYFRHLDNLLQREPIPDPFSVHKLYFLKKFSELEAEFERSAAQAADAPDCLPSASLYKRFREELLSVQPRYVHDDDEHDYYRSFEEPYIHVSHFASYVKSCVDKIPVDDLNSLKDIDCFIELVQKVRQSKCSSDLDYTLFCLLRARIYKHRFMGFKEATVIEADLALTKILLQKLDARDHDGLESDEAEILVLEGFFHLERSDFQLMTECFESAIERALTSSNAEFYLIARTHLHCAMYLHNVQNQSEMARTAIAAKHLLQGLAYATKLKSSGLVAYAEEVVAEFMKNYPHSFWHTLVAEKLAAARLAVPRP